MNLQEIEKNVKEALSTFNPIEVRAAKESEDVVRLLVLSERFADVSMFKRIKDCSNLLVKHCALHYLFIIEPVTPAEFETRNPSWK